MAYNFPWYGQNLMILNGLSPFWFNSLELKLELVKSKQKHNQMMLFEAIYQLSMRFMGLD